MKVKHIGGDGDLQEFNDEFPKHNLVVAGFFAVWCGHCKTFKPEWEKFTKQAETSPIAGLVATIPEEHMKGAKCDQSKFPGFPTVRIFRKKGFQDYTGKREAGALMDHIKTLVSQHGGALTDDEVAAPASDADVGGVGPVISPSDTSTGKWTKEEFLSRKDKPLIVRIHHLEANEAKLMTPLDIRDDGEGGWWIEFGMGEKENNIWARTSLYRPGNIKSFQAASTRGGGKKTRKRRRSSRKKTRRRGRKHKRRPRKRRTRKRRRRKRRTRKRRRR